jgi:protein-L-isoaspartate(D-aspartate) O-methyltransferase
MQYDVQNARLINHIKSRGYLKSEEIENALRHIKRHNFVPEDITEMAYEDMPLSIGHDQTISQPSTVVAMTEALEVKPGHKVLEIGSGSGWQAAILAKLVNTTGIVYTIEIVRFLAEFARKNLIKQKVTNVKIVCGDGSLGLEKYAPYDRIIVTAACPKIPKPFLEQLKVGGIMVIPVGNVYLQQMHVINKLERGIEEKTIGSFMFVPLKGKFGFKE